MTLHVDAMAGQHLIRHGGNAAPSGARGGAARAAEDGRGRQQEDRQLLHRHSSARTPGTNEVENGSGLGAF